MTLKSGEQRDVTLRSTDLQKLAKHILDKMPNYSDFETHFAEGLRITTKNGKAYALLGESHVVDVELGNATMPKSKGCTIL